MRVRVNFIIDFFKHFKPGANSEWAKQIRIYNIDTITSETLYCCKFTRICQIYRGFIRFRVKHPLNRTNDVCSHSVE